MNCSLEHEANFYKNKILKKTFENKTNLWKKNTVKEYMALHEGFMHLSEKSKEGETRKRLEVLTQFIIQQPTQNQKLWKQSPLKSN